MLNVAVRRKCAGDDAFQEEDFQEALSKYRRATEKMEELRKTIEEYRLDFKDETMTESICQSRPIDSFLLLIRTRMIGASLALSGEEEVCDLTDVASTLEDPSGYWSEFARPYHQIANLMRCHSNEWAGQ